LNIVNLTTPFDKTSNQLLLTQGEELLAAAKDADQYPGWGDE
jgi:hypothetical protein